MAINIRSLTQQKSMGFTLAEVLIALALLGVVAAFTIPKLVATQGNQERNSRFAETISMLSGILHEAQLNGGLNGQSLSPFFIQRLNTIKVCPTNAALEGCWNTVVSGEGIEPGLLLPNNVAIVGFNDWPSVTEAGSFFNGLWIDYNGLKPPNVRGVDQMALQLCYGEKTCTYNTGLGVTTKIAGTVYPAPYNYDMTLYKSALGL